MTHSQLQDTRRESDDEAVLSRPSGDSAPDRSRFDDEYAALIKRQPSDLPLFDRGRYKNTSAIVPAGWDVAFIYWRHSTDEQDTSEYRQVTDCNAYAAKIRRHVGGVFGDAGKSGTSMAKRTGLQDMMAQVRQRRPKMVIIEDLDRLSRKLADLLNIFSELTMLGVELHDVAHGKLDLVHVIIRGFMGEEGRVRFLKMSASAKRKAVAHGHVMHQPPYGYLRHDSDVGVHVQDRDGTAKIVKLIFEMAAAGSSARAIARELTRRQLPPPAQSRLERRGGSVAKLKQWRGASVTKILRNYIYCGFVCWGMPNLSKAAGEEVIVELEELAIVDRDLWTKANLRLCEVQYGYSTGGSHYLLTGKAVCACCGSALVSYSTGSTPRYVCSKRFGSKTCTAYRYVRIDFLETAVLQRVFCEAVDDCALARYAKRLRRELPLLLKDDAKQRAALERRLERIEDLLMRAYEDERQKVISPKRARRIRELKDAEADGIEKQLASLRTESEFVIGLDAVEALSANYATMLAEIPFRPEDPEGMRLARCFRDVISRVVVHQPDAAGDVRVVIELDPFLQMRDGKRRDDVEAYEPMVLETSFNPAALNRQAAKDRNERAYWDIDAAAVDGRHAISDAYWAVAEPFVSPLGFMIAGVDASRKLIDGMLWLACGGGRWHKIPQVFGRQTLFQGAIRSLIYRGAWDALVEALRDAGAPFVKDLGFFDRVRFRRRCDTGPRPDAATATADRKELLALAKKHPEGSITRRRCEVVAGVLGGLLTVEAASTAGVTKPAAYSYWRLYMEEGVDGLKPKDKVSVESKLSNGNVATLKKLAKTGVDPDRPGRALTIGVLQRLARERFGVTYSLSGMKGVMRRHKFDLPAYHVQARREGRLST